MDFFFSLFPEPGFDLARVCVAHLARTLVVCTSCGFVACTRGVRGLKLMDLAVGFFWPKVFELSDGCSLFGLRELRSTALTVVFRDRITLLYIVILNSVCRRDLALHVCCRRS